MSLYSIYFTQVLLPLLDLRYSQSHSNITIATENAFVLFFFFCHFSELIRHLRAFPSFTNYEQVSFVFAFKSLQLHILKKSFVMCLYLTNISFLEYFFQFIFTGITDLRTASFLQYSTI